MASAYTELTYLSYVGTETYSGNSVKAIFSFQGINRGANNLDANRTWSVSFSNTDGPMCALVANNQTVSGVTAKILTSGTESQTTSGTLEMYPLTAGTAYSFQSYTEGGTPEVWLDFTPVLNNNPRAKDLASGTLAESISASTTTLLVYVGEGGATTIRNVWPDVPFYASIMPASPSAGVPNSLDSEIVKVTNVSNDQVGNTALTVTRAQRGTTGKAFTAGAIVTNADYAEDAVLLGDEGSAETPTPWITTEDILDGAITGDKLDWGSIVEVVGNSDDNRCWKFDNGLMIAAVKKSANITFSKWNAIYESETIFPPNYAAPFVATPAVTVSLLTAPYQAWVGLGSGRTGASGYEATTTRGQGVVLLRDGTGSGAYIIGWLAIGRWK